MSKTIELTDAQHAALASLAEAKGQSLKSFLAQVIEGLEEREGGLAYYDTDDWFRHLGVSEDQIRRANARFAAREAAGSDADAQ